MSKSSQPTASTRGSPDEPTPSSTDDEDPFTDDEVTSIDDEDPFTDDDVTSILDDAWDRLQS